MSDERTRLDALRSYEILDTLPEPEYDDLPRLAAQICDTPMAIFTLVDEARQWFKASAGLSIRETERCHSFCSHAIEGDDPFIVEDARKDPRFSSNPYVTGDPGIRFYAGVPLKSSMGPKLGTIAVLDRIPRQLTKRQLTALQTLARHAMTLLELRLERNRHRLTSARLDAAQKVGQVGFWEHDVDADRLTWTDQVYEIFGVDRNSFATTFEAFRDFVPPEDLAALTAQHHRALADGSAMDLQHRLVRPDGRIRHVRARAQLYRRAPGASPVLVGTVQDVTSEHEAESALRLSEGRFRGIIGSAAVGIVACNVNGRIQSANEVFCRMLGYTEFELTALDKISLVHPDDRARYQNAMDRLMAGDIESSIMEMRCVRKNGVVLWSRVSVSAQSDPAGKPIGMIVIAEDVTEQRQVEGQLRLLESAIARTNDLVIITEANLTDGESPKIVYVNDAFERRTQFSREEILGKTPRMLQGVNTSRSELNRIRLSLERMEPVRAQLTNYQKDGKEYSIELEIAPVFDRNGRCTHFVAIERDITERLALEAQLRQSQRLESVGQLTGGVAHDFNNLLTVVLGNADLLYDELDENDARRPLAEMIVGAAQKGAELTQRLLAFSRRQALDPKIVDINQLLHGMQGLLQRTLGEHIEIAVVAAENLARASVDPGQLESSVLNLCLNARDAMPAGGRLTIETANMVLDLKYAAVHSEVRAGRYVMLAVSDTGVGISAQDLPRVFEPFFTTKETGKGTGLGLAMVYGFIKQSGGHVSIYSEPGQGTSVKMYLPSTDAEQEPSSQPVEAELTGGSERILLVEDDPMVRSFARKELVSLGYRVVEAANALTALDLLRGSEVFDLLFTDVVMPGGMSGKQLADEALKVRPALKVLYTSGYTENAIVHHGRLDPGVTLLPKPYRRKELADKVRNTLARP
jgi:PAS domain S-box-containing protein